MRIRKTIFTFKENCLNLWECFFPNPSYQWGYLGYAYWNIGSSNYPIVEEFFKGIDKTVRPWWCPKWFLRLLHLYGNDNSIVRVRYRWIHNLYRGMTKGIFITDMKWKYESFRIYGYFTDELEEAAEECCRRLEELNEE